MHNFLKDYLAGSLSPTPMAGFLLFIGVILLWRNKLKWGRILVTLSAFYMLLFGFDPFTEWALHTYENKYPHYQRAHHDSVKYVVVLAGGLTPSKTQPLTSELTPHTFTRLIEGIRIQRENPESFLVVTGKGWHEITEARAMKEMAVKLGVPEDKIITEEESMNTLDHTKYLKPILGDKKFVLVTSAIHMPRAHGLFTKAGFDFIPAPTHYYLRGDYSFLSNKYPFAKGDNLVAADAWFIEFCGNMWARLKGDI